MPSNAAVSVSSVPSDRVRRDGDRVWIDNIPPARGDGNRYIRGLEMLLGHAGTPVTYDRLMSLSGMAFITQADSEHRWEGKVDVGWWPLDPWCIQLRREFLGQAIGRELREVGYITCTPEQFLQIRDRLPQVYHEQIQPHVKAAIDAGQPVLSTCDIGFVITGYDSAADQPPVWGRCAADTTGKSGRPAGWPYGLFILGERMDGLKEDAADVAALRFAVALAHDQAGPYEPQWRSRRFTGQKAYAAWASVLRKMDEPVEDRHHANMKLHLRINRTAAVAFLRSVAGRHQGAAADSLREAAASYERVLALVAQINPKGLSTNPQARRTLADLVDRIAKQELEAAQLIERVVTPADGAINTTEFP